MKKNLKLFFIIFLILLLIVAIASFSWFSNIENVAVTSPSNMTVQVGSKLEIGIRDNGEIKWSEGKSLELNKELTVMDCSGDGKTFFAPATVDENGEPLTFKQLGNDELKNYMIDTYISLRTNTALDVYLGSKSSVLPNKDVESIYGNFLAGYISGCVRVGFFEVTYDESGKIPTIGDTICVWAPNSQVEYSYDADNTETNELGEEVSAPKHNVNPDGNREDEYTYFIDANGNTETYTVDDYMSGKFSIAEGSDLCTADNSEEAYGINQAPKIISFSDKGGVKDILIRVWFEGTDREAESVFNSGKINYNFSLVGLAPVNAEFSQEMIEELKALAISKNGGTVSVHNASYVWSVDGIDWTSLGTNINMENIGNANGVYVALYDAKNGIVGKTLNTDVIYKEFK